MLLGRQQECAKIGRLLEGARQGVSGVLVLRGAPGTGKSALLSWAVQGAKDFSRPRRLGCGVGNGAALRRAPPVVPTAARSGRRSARASTKGIANQLWDTGGTAARALFVGLAVLSLLSGASRSQPLLCVIDDAQWLDSASARAMALAARRLDADAVAVVFATRSDDSDDTLSGLPDLLVGSLMDADAAALLRQAAPGRLDAEVVRRILAEARGNPFALLELPRRHGPVGMAGGFAPGEGQLSSRLEATFVQRSRTLPPETRLALLLAAAEPVGDPSLLRRAAGALGIGTKSLVPAEDEGLIEVGTMVRFRHPLVRSALYGAAERRRPMPP